MPEKHRKAPSEADGTDRALARLHALVREKGLNSSSVRDAITRAAVSYKGHFEASDIAEALRKSGLKGGHLATVYRTLPLLLEAGVIQQTMLSAGERHLYESTFEREHHDHLVCHKCGTVIEFRSEAFEAMERELAARYDFELTSHVHELIGVCAKCRRRAQSARAALQE
ncbi:MAG: transcriptional repressor [Polyangiaceae bacterium]